MTVLDCVDEGPVLSAELAKPKNITKAQIQRCISKLSSHWDVEQLEAVVSMFREHGLL
tara:strand:+ start:888 stop:1061 length:174 start_codon:yes stop_codon:yes gene_type:complete